MISMRSIKPGRGPSFMGGIASIAVSIFGVFWTIMAASMGAPIFFPLFGIIFVALGIAQAIYNFKNATGKNRYSAFDITEHGEEQDPWNTRFGEPEANMPPPPAAEDGYCPYCGATVKNDHAFCKSCGKKII